MNRISMLAGCILAGLMLAIVGCGGDGKVSVKVKIVKDGKGVDGAAVVFQSGTPTPCSGVTDANGEATIAAPAGEYKVTVSKTEVVAVNDPKASMDMMKKMMTAGKGGPGKGGPAKDLMPEEYTKLDTTKLSIKVPAATQPVIFEIK